MRTAAPIGGRWTEYVGARRTLRLPPPGSDVVLQINMQRWANQYWVPVYLVAESGAYLATDYAGIRGAISAEGWRTYHIPLLAVGSWTVVALDSPAQLRTLSSGAGGSLSAVARFVSRAGDKIEVEVP